MNQQEIIEFAKSCKLRGGLMYSPMLYTLSLAGKAKTPKYHYWQIILGIMHGKELIPVNVQYCKKKPLPDGAVGMYSTVSGAIDGKELKSGITKVLVGKNIGKQNETTGFTQAIYDARSLFNLKLRKGAELDKAKLKIPGGLVTIEDLITDTGRGLKPWRIFVMAVHNVNHATKNDTNWKHVTFPGTIQPKYDGTRFATVYHHSFGIDGFSRGRETYEGQEHILNELEPVLKNHPGLYIDGELWLQGASLQQVSGSSRRQADSKTRTETVKLEYYIFDCFRLDEKLTWIQRLERFKQLQQELSGAKYIKFAPSYRYNNKEAAIAKYQEYVERGYEGGILRNDNAPYEWGINKEIRSYQTLKIKPDNDDEWPVIGFTEGTVGKDKGALIWILAATPETIERHNTKYGTAAKLMPDNQFTAVTKGLNYEQRYAAYRFLSHNQAWFDANLKNEDMTVQFSIISDYGKPQQPKVLGFRDQAKNKEFLDKL